METEILRQLKSVNAQYLSSNQHLRGDSTVADDANVLDKLLLLSEMLAVHLHQYI